MEQTIFDFGTPVLGSRGKRKYAPGSRRALFTRSWMQYPAGPNRNRPRVFGQGRWRVERFHVRYTKKKKKKKSDNNRICRWQVQVNACRTRASFQPPPPADNYLFMLICHRRTKDDVHTRGRFIEETRAIHGETDRIRLIFVWSRTWR